MQSAPDREIPKIRFLKKRPIELDIISLSHVLQKKGADHNPADFHRLGDFYLIFFVERGRGEHFIDFQRYEYQTNDLIITSRDQIQAFGKHTKSEGRLILFTEKFLLKNAPASDNSVLHSLHNYQIFSPVLRSAGTDIRNAVALLTKEWHKPEDYQKEIILHQLLMYLLLLVTRRRIQVQPAVFDIDSYQWFSRFIRAVEARHLHTRTATDYAAELSLSYKHLGTICRRVTGRTPKAIIDDFVVLEIKRQLATGTTPVADLAVSFGFDEVTNFVKYFKKHSRMTPGQFRASLSSSQDT